MAIGDVLTDATSISIRVQNDIYLQSIIPLAYATPMVLMCDNEPLRKRGKTLQHQFLVEQDEYADASSYELTTMAQNETIGVEEILLGSKTYDVSKRVKSHIITDLAKYHDLGDISDESGSALRSGGARTINSLLCDALLASAGGLMWQRQDALATCQIAELLVDSGTHTTTTLVCDQLTQADDYWNGAQVTFESGQNISQTFTVSDWVLSTNTLTLSTMPNAPVEDDKFRICQPGYSDESAAEVLGAADTPTLKAILSTAARCRVFGASSPMAAQGGGFSYDRAGIRRVISPSIASGVIFLHEFLMENVMDTLSSTDVVANQALWQTDQGLSRIVGGGLRRMGNMLWVPINHHKRRASADGTLSNSAGDLWPVFIMFKGCALSTRLRDAPGDRLGLVFNTKIPSRNDTFNKYDAIKMINEGYMHNAFGGKNSLHGAIHWCTTEKS